MNSDETRQNRNEENEDQQTVSHFMSSVTTHGCQHIFQSKSKLVKICWTIFVLTSISIAGYLLHEAIVQYYKYRTHDDVSHKDAYVDFPAVSVCRLDDDSLVRLYSTSTGHGSIIEKGDPDLIAEDAEVFNRFFKKLNSPEIKLSEFLIKEYSRKILNRQSIPQAFPALADYLSSDYERLIVSCRFNDQDCNKTHFVEKKNGQYLNCFTFNHSYTVKKEGPKAGLSLVFYLDAPKDVAIIYFTDDESMDFTDTGIKVAIHEPNTIPDMINDGIIAPPGFSTNIALTQSVVENREPPWGKCNKTKLKFTEIVDEDTNIVYNRKTCIKICQQRYIHGKCGCLNIMLPVPNDLKNEIYCFYIDRDNLFQETNWTTGFIQGLKRMDCEYQYLEDLPDTYVGKYKCDCPISCRYLTYDSLISVASWPPQNGVNRFVGKYMKDHYTLLNGTDMHKAFVEGKGDLYDLVQRDFLRLNVYYRSLTVQTTSQVKAYTIQNLISEIGGIFGICVGMSALSILELFHLIGIIVHKFRKKVNRRVEQP